MILLRMRRWQALAVANLSLVIAAPSQPACARQTATKKRGQPESLSEKNSFCRRAS